MLFTNRLQLNSKRKSLAFGALLLGATCIGVAPLLVRSSEVGPSATAFWRILIALPLVGFAARLGGASPVRGLPWKLLAIAGVCFCGDLSLWHWSLQYTTVANSTLMTNLAPLFVIVGARIWFHEKPSAWLYGGLAICLLGAGLLVGKSIQLGSRFLIGDGLAVSAALFYSGYLLAVKQLRRSISTSWIMWGTGIFSTGSLLVVGLLANEKMIPATAHGWKIVLLMAIICHIGGQGLIAYSLAHLPASFSSVSLLWQPVVAAALAWWFLNEKLGAVQIVGGIIVLAGLGVAAVDNQKVRPIAE